MAIIGDSGAHHRGFRCPLEKVQVPIKEGAGANYMGFRCSSLGIQVPIIGGSDAHDSIAFPSASGSVHNKLLMAIVQRQLWSRRSRHRLLCWR